jgi:PAS domain S-box-containing protein
MNPQSAFRNPQSGALLIVEDSPTQAEQLRDLLDSHGYLVTVARNGQEALGCIRQHPPALVITDIVMPHLDGYGLCRQIKADPGLNHIPVMLLTSLTDPVDVIRGLECGADSFNGKPWEACQLLSRISCLLANWHLREADQSQKVFAVHFSGQKFLIQSDRLQILNFLLATYETAIEKNAALAVAQNELVKLNEQLEQRVCERTAALAAGVADRHRAEAQIRDQAALLNQTNDAILVRSLAGEITLWNRGAELLFGWSAPEALGRNAKDILAPAASREKIAAVEQELQKKGHWLGEMDYVTKSGKHLIGQARATLVRDAAGAPQSILVLITDITEQKLLEAQFLRAQRLEAVGTLASGIAHDLNNILAPILMAVPILREPQTPEAMVPTLDLVESSALRAADVVRQLLTFSRGLGGERIPLHLKHLLRDLRNIARETFPKNIRFTSQAAPDLWLLVADPTQLHQLLLNLCINARDAMPRGGTLAVTAANFSVDDQFANMVTGAHPGAYVQLQVQDTGTGIAPGNLDKIFDPFFTTKEVGRGTGLGLATVQKVVIGHGGFLRVRSQMGTGTTFEVYLPAAPHAVALAESAAPPPALAGQGELILLVEDEEHIQETIQATLLRHGYRAVVAGNGIEAIDIFSQRRKEIKAVLTDLMMPVMDGLALVRVLAKVAPGLPVVVSTGFGNDPDQEENLEELRRLGVSTFLTKPYTSDQLLHALHGALNQPGLMNTPNS